jgi:hypothetical protein
MNALMAVNATKDESTGRRSICVSSTNPRSELDVRRVPKISYMRMHVGRICP